MDQNLIIQQMKEIFKDIPFGIEHTLKVLKNAEDIMAGENVSDKERELISIVAILHDIGAVEAQRKYGSIDGAYQEKEGPSKIDGLDFQIQWEADLLENLIVMDKQKKQLKIKKCIEENYKTATGKKIAYNRFILD